MLINKSLDFCRLQIIDIFFPYVCVYLCMVQRRYFQERFDRTQQHYNSISQ